MSRSAPMLRCPMTFAPMIQFGTPFGCLKSYSAWPKSRVDEVLDVVVHGYKREPRTGRYLIIPKAAPWLMTSLPVRASDI